MAREPVPIGVMGRIFARLPGLPSTGSTGSPHMLHALRRRALPWFPCVVALTLAGCAIVQHDAREKRFAERFPYQDLNRTIVLEPIEGVTRTTIGRVIMLHLVNKSDHIVTFSPRDDLVGLVYDAERNEWVEVENAVMYPEIVEGLWPRGSGLPIGTVVDFEPVLDQRVDSINIRVLVVGRLWDEEHGFGEAVAAYIDLTLKP